MRRLFSGLVVVALTLPLPSSAQVLQGRVVDGERLRPLPTALVRLLDEERNALVISVADSLGGYRLTAPGPGRYYVSVEHLGYETFVSHLLEMGRADGVYPVGLEMRSDPVAIAGITVRADRFASIQRRLRTLIGMRPSSLRVKPMMRPEIDDHVDRGHTLEDIIRWGDLPSITVKASTEGPCFQYRSRGCIEVFLDGVHVNPEFVTVLPLDLVEAIVIVMPTESIVYEAGAILLYSAGWIG